MKSKIFNSNLLSLWVVGMLLFFSVTELHADNNPLCFTARNGSVTVKFTINNVTPSDIQYSTDLTTWNTCSAVTNVALNADESVYFRAATDKTSATAVAFGSTYLPPSKFAFSSLNSGTVEASGNIMSLYGPNCPDIQLPPRAFSLLFDSCALLTSAPELPATHLSEHCYGGMFQHCTSLTTAPALPATILADYCYEYMFFDCTSLTAPPALPATTLADECYYWMFGYCTSLTTAPALPATILAEECYGGMFVWCALTTAPALPATTLADYCYENMFNCCTSLTTAPALPATTLASGCYYQMFCGCHSLTTAPALPATTLTDYCYYGMFQYCTSLTTAPALPAIILADYCYEVMFHSCVSIKAIPTLPASYLPPSCYYCMFKNCSSLQVNRYGPGMNWRISSNSVGSLAVDNMFTGTGGTMNGTPSVNTTYYVFYTIDSVLSDTICLGNSYTDNGFNVSSAYIRVGDNTFTRTISGLTGNPDTVVKLNLFAVDSVEVTNANICQGGSYIFEGQYYTQPGTYRVASTNVHGCPFSKVLNLTTFNIEDDFYDIACEGYPYIGYGITNLTVTKDTVIVIHTRTADFKCDSVSRIHIKYIPKLYKDEWIVIEQGETYYGYDSPGDYVVTLSSSIGCDSIVTIHLATIDGSTGIDDISDVKIDIAPNPVNAGATALIHGDFGEVDRVEIANGFGQMVDSFVPDTYPIEVEGIEASGIYYVRLIAKDGNVHVRKMIVQ